MYTLTHSVRSNSTFIMKVMNYTGMAIAVTAFGSYIAPYIFPLEFLTGGGMWLIFISELVLIFTSSRWANLARPANILIYSLFAFLSGLTLYPILYVALQVGGIDIVFKALTATVALSLGAGIYAKTTSRDLTGLGGILMMSLIGLLIVGVLQMFWFNSMVELISSGFSVILFSVFIAFKIQIIEKYPDDRAIEASIDLYLSIYNLFISILRLLMALNRN